MSHGEKTDYAGAFSDGDGPPIFLVISISSSNYCYYFNCWFCTSPSSYESSAAKFPDFSSCGMTISLTLSKQ